MPQYLSGPGLGLALPQYLYPTELNNAPADIASNKIALAPGQALPIPAGDWYIALGMYCVIQFLDPITGTWQLSSGAALNRGTHHISSDGFNVRIANLTGCPVSAAVVAPGSSYVQATTTVAVTGGGGATWLPIVGGILAGASVVSAGAGYGVAPILFIPGPPPAANNSNGVGGVQAEAYAVISSGTVSGVTFTNPGAGYPSAPTVTVLPNPTDPNISTGITAASITVSLTGTGSIAAVLCTNNGAPLTNGSLTNYTLTVSGAGSAASVTANVMQTIVTASITGQGTAYGQYAQVQTYGGAPSQGTFTNSQDYLYLGFMPRPANIGLSITGTGTIGTQLGTIYDGGLFMSAPTSMITSSAYVGVATVVGATLSVTAGSKPDIVVLQPAP